MLLTPHTLTGVYIASRIPDPRISWPLASVAHFIFDRFPHWDYLEGASDTNFKMKGRDWAFLSLDFTLGLFVGLFFALQAPVEMQSINIIGAAFFSNLPDGLEAPAVLFGRRWKWQEKLISLQSWNQWKWSLPWGLLSQAVLAAGLIYFML